MVDQERCVAFSFLLENAIGTSVPFGLDWVNMADVEKALVSKNRLNDFVKSTIYNGLVWLGTIVALAPGKPVLGLDFKEFSRELASLSDRLSALPNQQNSRYVRENIRKSRQYVSTSFLFVMHSSLQLFEVLRDPQIFSQSQ